MVDKGLKKWVDDMCAMIERFGQMVEMDDNAGDMARAELGMYMMYLSASDGVIAWQEAEVISEICNLRLTAQDLGKFIQEHGIYSEAFESTVPESFQLVVAADEALLQAGQIQRDGLISSAMIDTYRAVGQALLTSDEGVTKSEAADYTIYTNMLAAYQKKMLG